MVRKIDHIAIVVKDADAALKVYSEMFGFKVVEEMEGPAGEFKARCLRVMEEVRKYRTPVVITKKGRPVAKLVPPDAPATDVFGCLAGSARIVGDIEAPVVGDRILNQVAARFLEGLRASDIAVRWGGEEFLIVLKGCELDHARRIAEHVRAEIEQTEFKAGKKSIAVTVSIGVSQYVGVEPHEATISRADTGLYAAKNSGRNRVCVETNS